MSQVFGGDAMEIKDVPRWLVIGNTGHALVSHNPGSIMAYETACGTIGNVGTKIDTPPMQICSRCREAIDRKGVSS